MYKVLLIDDEKMALISTEHSFEWHTHGFQVYKTFCNPFDALDTLKSERIDIAFIDLRMPEMSGFDIINTCKEYKINTGFVIVTGYSDFHYAQKAIKLDVLDYCVKPIQKDEVEYLLPKLRSTVLENRLIEDSKYINDLMKSENPSELLSYLTLNVHQKHYWVVGIASNDPIENIIVRPQGSTHFHLMLDQHKAISIYGDDSDITDLLKEDYSLIDTGVVFISSILDHIKLISFTIRLILSKLEIAALDQAAEILCLDMTEKLDINTSFLSIMDFVNDQYDQDLSLQALSKEYNINYTYCSELFKKVTGSSFTNYLTTLRLKKACELLATSDQNITDIAYHVGYNNYHYFAKVFKKTFGVTPAQFQQKVKRGPQSYEV